MTAANIVTGRSIHVALVVGDTAGHTHPALAVAEALRSRHSDARVLFLGTSDSIAAGIVAKAGQPFVAVPGSPIRRANLAGLARAAGRGVQAIGDARRILVDHDIHVAMGFGGFASGGVLLGARSLRVPTAILEANVELGLANRWLRPWVTRVFQGLAPPGADAVGVPVRASVVALRDAAPRVPREVLRVFVASGSRGAGFFAERLPTVVGQLTSRGIALELWQQPVDAFVEDVASAYHWADVVIARAGANTIAELAIAGLPAVLVPLGDASANHQAANARVWQDAGAGVAIAEGDWRDADVVEWLRRMATDTQTRHAAGAAARRLARPDAAAHLAEACVALVRRRA
jgi:UDP-N-acetylglucosamine--N-acetylmuramyl-(pentapeptide) pyrophosphoryl-undecaprenol N-acetylglucosamine transferase